MPITSTKNFSLSSGFGVSISMWPRWARSKIGSGVIVLLLITNNSRVVIPREGGVSSTPRRFHRAKPSRSTGSSAFADDDSLRMLAKRARDVVEQLVDAVRARDQALLRGVGNNQLERAPHLVWREVWRR